MLPMQRHVGCSRVQVSAHCMACLCVCVCGPTAQLALHGTTPTAHQSALCATGCNRIPSGCPPNTSHHPDACLATARRIHMYPQHARHAPGTMAARNELAARNRARLGAQQILMTNDDCTVMPCVLARRSHGLLSVHRALTPPPLPSAGPACRLLLLGAVSLSFDGVGLVRGQQVQHDLGDLVRNQLGLLSIPRRQQSLLRCK